MENLQSTYTHIVNKLRLLHTNNNNLSIFQTTDCKLSLIFYTTYDKHRIFAVYIHAYSQ